MNTSESTILPAPLVFITGASSGIGQALAQRYAQAGWRLALVARRGALMREWATAQSWPAHQWAVYEADVRHEAEVAEAARACLQAQGLPEVVIANAGISVGMDTADFADLDVMRATFETNNLGMAATFQPFVGPMCARRSGTLVGIASVAGIRGLPGAGAYSASKAGALAYLESLRVETTTLDGQGVVDDQLHRHHRVDLGRVAAFVGNGVTQAGEVDQRGLAENVVAHHAGREPREVEVALALDQLAQRGIERSRIAAAHQVLGEHAGRVWQAVVGAGLDRLDRRAGIKVVQVGAWQVLAVCSVHHGIRLGHRIRKVSPYLWERACPRMRQQVHSGCKAGAFGGTPAPTRGTGCLSIAIQRCSIGTNWRCSTPTYSALGRMMRLLARCSKTCAAQPVSREQTKIGVNSLVGMPMK